MLEKRLIYVLASTPFFLLAIVLGTLHGSIHLIVGGVSWGVGNLGFIVGLYVERFFVVEGDVEEPEIEVPECEEPGEPEAGEELGEGATEETAESAAEEEPEQEEPEK